MITTERQVTLYPHRDDNNWWTIEKIRSEDEEGNEEVETNEVEYIKHGDVVKFLHTKSETKRLHSHDIRPPMTDLEYHNEVR